jgi:hypothetical protein
MTAAVLALLVAACNEQAEKPREGTVARRSADSASTAFMVVERSSSTVLTPGPRDDARLPWALYARAGHEQLAVQEDLQSAEDAEDEAWDILREPSEYPWGDCPSHDLH